jgi:competence protein ComEC
MLLLTAILTAEAYDGLSADGALPLAIDRWAGQTRHLLTEPIDSLNLDGNAKAALAATTLGSRESMSRETSRSFSAAGAAHILSVSGFHVGALYGFVAFALSLLGNGPAVLMLKRLVTIVVIWTFAVVTGLAPPTIRAAVTLSLYLCAQMINRRSTGYNNLCAAALLMLICNPRNLFDAGFQLSYISVASIIFLQPRIVSIIEVRNPVLRAPWEWLALSLAAQAGVSFMCMYYFGEISTVFLPANLCLSLISALLIPVALLWMLLPSWIPMYYYLERSVEFLARSMVQITDSFAQTPWATVSLRLDASTTVFCYVTMLLGLYLWFGGKKKGE